MSERSDASDDSAAEMSVHVAVLYVLVNLVALAGILYASYVAVASGGENIPFLILAVSFVVGFSTAQKLEDAVDAFS